MPIEPSDDLVSKMFLNEAKLVARSERHPSRPSLFQRSVTGEPRAAFDLDAGLQQLSIHQSLLLEQLQALQQADGHAHAAGDAEAATKETDSSL